MSFSSSAQIAAEEPKDGGPAYIFKCRDMKVYYGMSLRDWFAGQALAGYRANSMLQEHDTVAEWAYGDADAMLKARENKEEP